MGIAVGGPIAAAIIASLELRQPGPDQVIIDGSCKDITPAALLAAPLHGTEQCDALNEARA